jgi:hypothetical protein
VWNAEFLRLAVWPQAVEMQLSFEDKYRAKDGPSAAILCAMLLDNLFTGAELESEFAITGDLNADGSIQPKRAAEAAGEGLAKIIPVFGGWDGRDDAAGLSRGDSAVVAVDCDPRLRLFSHYGDGPPGRHRHTGRSLRPIFTKPGGRQYNTDAVLAAGGVACAACIPAGLRSSGCQG